jgi:lambda family phage portal protein
MLIALRNLFSGRRSAKPGARNFSGSSTSRLSTDWIIAPLSADAAMRGRLSALRSRCRDLERNNEWARGFLRTLENNVVGEAGISLQMRIREVARDGTERFDEVANDKIENAWWQWGRKGKCTICGRHTWRDVQRMVVRSLGRDGEILIRKIRQRGGLKLQIIEADLLDENANFIASNGNEVRFGVEIDGNRAVVAYHLLGRHPGDMDFQAHHGDRVRIPAEDIIHLFLSERPDQSRGIPWLVASMVRLKMLDGYAEAELVAARTGAAKMGFFTKSTPEGWDGEIDGDGNLSMDASPGTIEELPPGVDFKSWSSDHPNSGYGDFVKSGLRGVASSLGISYNTLSSDLEGVNYSSIRAGLLEEREVWKAIQRFLIEHMCEDVFSEWLSLELLSGRLGLPFEKMWKFDVPEFQGRRWAWVDPKKDMEAAILAIRSGQTSLRKVVSEQGSDIYDVLRSQKADSDLAASLGVTLPELTDTPKAAPLQAEIDTD